MKNEEDNNKGLCSLYFEEYTVCNSSWINLLKSKYANLQLDFENCKKLKEDFQNCKLWAEKNDLKAFNKLQKSKSQRLKRYCSQKTKVWNYK